MAGVADAALLWRNRDGTWHTLSPEEKRVAAMRVRRAATAWTDLVHLVRSVGGNHKMPMLATQKAHDLLHILYCLEMFGSSDATTTGAVWS
jgi:hypothetical protein